MNSPLRLPVLAATALLFHTAFAGPAENTPPPAPALDPHLEPFRPLLGKTWRGTFAGGGEKPATDIAKWERALNGTAVRVLHSVNDGVYGGESLILWDAEKKSLATHYFTTAGFRTTGAMTVSGGKFTAEEEVKGEAGGITRVRSVTELLPDGTFRIKSEYFKNDAWQPGREALYREDAKAVVVFK